MITAGEEKQEARERDNRVAARKRLSIPAMLQVLGKRRVKTMLRDISVSGFSASVQSRIPLGSTCWLQLPGREPMEARVVWCDYGLAGCEFDKLIPRVTYDAIFERWEADSASRR